MGPRLYALIVFAVVSGCTRSEPRPEARESAAPTPPASATAAPAVPDTPPATAGATPATDGGASMTKSLSVSSPAFTAGAIIPAKHTCEGGDRSPPLEIADLPSGTKTLALVVEDPDAPDPAAPKHVWAHWVAYDLPATTRVLEEGAGNQQRLGRVGKNDWGERGYRGPCPPIGRHRYFFRVFALDRELGDLHEPSKADLLQAIDGHVLARGELMGTYQKTR